MIEKKIHQIWLGTKPKSELVERCIDTVIDLNWQYKMWNDAELIDLFGKILHEQLGKFNFAFRTDVYRAMLVQKYGGFYLDCDVEVLQDFSDLCNTDFVANISFYNDQKMTLMNEFFGSVPGGRMIGLVVDRIGEIMTTPITDDFIFTRSFSHVVTNNIGMGENIISTREYNKYLKHHFTHSW